MLFCTKDFKNEVIDVARFKDEKDALDAVSYLSSKVSSIEKTNIKFLFKLMLYSFVVTFFVMLVMSFNNELNILNARRVVVSNSDPQYVQRQPTLANSMTPEQVAKVNELRQKLLDLQQGKVQQQTQPQPSQQSAPQSAPPPAQPVEIQQDPVVKDFLNGLGK